MEKETRWAIAPSPGDFAETLARDLGISPVTARILARRLPRANLEAGRAYLRPSLGDLLPPWRLRGMEEAATRIAKAIRNKERIVVYGDYDADGVTATALLLQIFDALDHPASHYLPGRIEEGYGISDQFVEKAIEDGIDVVITVDCGFCDADKITRLQEAGVDVIVTDHHEPGGDAPPPAVAVVNPKRADGGYAFRDLVGVGVAFKLAWAVCEKVAGSPKVGTVLQEALLSVLPDVAIGTVADVAPLLTENRICVAHGLKVIRRARPGLLAILEVAGLSPEDVTPRDVGFVIAPRLNAAGRMGDAELALRCLIATDPDEAARLAIELDRKNSQRQILCQKIHEEARQVAETTHDLDTAAALVVAHEGWHEGVIGIVASRLVEEYGRPAAVVALRDGETVGKGSARSIRGLNLYAAMSASKSRFTSFGGHELAAGFSIPRDQIEDFRKELQGHCREQVVEKQLAPELAIEEEMSLKQVSVALGKEIELLAPFGSGNPTPLFLARHIRIAGRPQLLGSSGRHFAFQASQDRVAFRAVAFNHPEWLQDIDGGAHHWDMVFAFNFNTYYSPARLELRIEDMRPC